MWIKRYHAYNPSVHGLEYDGCYFAYYTNPTYLMSEGFKGRSKFSWATSDDGVTYLVSKE